MISGILTNCVFNILMEPLSLRLHVGIAGRSNVALLDAPSNALLDENRIPYCDEFNNYILIY